MCGALGGFSSVGFNVKKVKKSVEKIIHRGPDNQSLEFFSGERIFLGHTRLSIIDLHIHSNQPFTSNCGRYSLVFNGEIFNFQELKKSCDWYMFKTNSDTEVLLAYYIKYKEKSLNYFEGMFGFCIYDSLEDNFFIARDRFGIKQIYYFNDRKQFVFSSEIKPLLVFKQKKQENLSVLRTFIEKATYDFGEETFFKDIFRLEAGCYLIVDKKTLKVKKTRWYELEKNLTPINMSYEESQEEVKTLFQKSIKKHLISDVDIGLNISGGLDSSILTYFVSKEKPNLATFNQDYKGFSEREWIDENLKTFSFNHHYLQLNADDIAKKIIPTVKMQEEPFGGIAVIGYNSIYEKANQLGIKVILDGNGVDETFLGYSKYLNNVNSSFVDGTGTSTNKLLSDDLLQYSLKECQVNNFINDKKKSLAINDLINTKIPRALRFNDRMSMNYGIELRVPFLDHKIVEFGLSLPTEYLIRKNRTKAIVRDMASQFLSHQVSFAKKRSVQTPQNLWLANGLRYIVEDIINSQSFKERGWYNIDLVKKTYSDYLLSEKSNSFFIWQWINLELWAREFLD